MTNKQLEQLRKAEQDVVDGSKISPADRGAIALKLLTMRVINRKLHLIDDVSLQEMRERNDNDRGFTCVSCGERFPAHQKVYFIANVPKGSDEFDSSLPGKPSSVCWCVDCGSKHNPASKRSTKVMSKVEKQMKDRYPLLFNN